jgi:outer membrane murein-binding lipoprotein Lpp
MTRRRLTTLLLVLAALVPALALAGCGDDVEKSNAYVDAVNKAQNDFAVTFDRLNKSITSTSTPKQDRDTLGRFGGAVEDVTQELTEVDPPEAVATLHRQLISEIGGYGEEVAKARKAFASTDPQKVIAAQTDLVTAVTSVATRINSTIDQINKKLRE